MPRREPIEWDEGWQRLQTGADKLIAVLEDEVDTDDAAFRERTESNMFQAEEHFEFYTTVFNMCTCTTTNSREVSAKLYKKYKSVIEDYLTAKVAPRVHGNGNLLSKAWRNHRVMVTWMTRFFDYLDRYYAVRNKLEPLTEVGMKCFLDCVLQPTEEAPTMDKLLELVALHRTQAHSDANDEAAMRDIVHLLADASIAQAKRRGRGPLLDNELRTKLLEETRSYYKDKAAEWSKFDHDSASGYLHSTQRVIAAEEHLATLLFPTDANSRRSVLDAVHEELPSQDAT